MSDTENASTESSANDVVLEVKDLVVSYGRNAVRNAVDKVSFTVGRGTTLAVIGESGSGKTSLCRAILGLLPVTAGSVTVSGIELSALKGRELRKRRRHLQAVFQDPFSSLDPRWSALQIVTEPLVVHGVVGRRSAGNRGKELIDAVGLPADIAERRPHEMSGGQRQRLAVARAIALEPDLIILDEPLSALDVSVQAQISNLLMDLQVEHGLTFVIVAHDMAAIKRISDDVLVMERGQAVEWGPGTAVFDNPQHPYTQSLIDATPTLPRFEDLVSR